MLVCAFCQEEVKASSPVLICKACLLCPKNQSIFLKAWKYFELKRQGKTSSFIKKSNPKTYTFLNRNGKLLRKLNNPLFILGKTLEEVEQELLFLRKSAGFRPLDMRPKERKKYYIIRKYGDFLDKFYGGYANYRRTKKDNEKWRSKLKRLASFIGERNLNSEEIRNFDPELALKIKKLGFNFCCDSAGLKKRKWGKWTVERIVGFSLEEIRKNPNIKYTHIMHKYGGAFHRMVLAEYGEKPSVVFMTAMRRILQRETNQQKYSIFPEEHFNLIHKVINSFFAKYKNDPFFYEEMFSAGKSGILVALELFDPEKNKTQWSTYAWGWIRSQIGRLVEKQDPRRMIEIPSHRLYEKEFNSAKYDNTSLNIRKGEEEEGPELIEGIVSGEEDIVDKIMLIQIKEVVEQNFSKEIYELFLSFLEDKKRPNKKLTQVFTFLGKRFFI